MLALPYGETGLAGKVRGDLLRRHKTAGVQDEPLPPAGFSVPRALKREPAAV